MVSESLQMVDVPSVVTVLILIVLEYGLGALSKYVTFFVYSSLNPYCAGIWSRSQGLCLYTGL